MAGLVDCEPGRLVTACHEAPRSEVLSKMGSTRLPNGPLRPVSQQVLAEERWDVIPGAEPAPAFADRVRAAIERMAAAHPGQRVAAFTHGGVIGEALARASGSRPFAFLGADNASISRLVISGGRWIVRGFNDAAHLESAA